MIRRNCELITSRICINDWQKGFRRNSKIQNLQRATNTENCGVQLSPNTCMDMIKWRRYIFSTLKYRKYYYWLCTTHNKLNFILRKFSLCKPALLIAYGYLSSETCHRTCTFQNINKVLLCFRSLPRPTLNLTHSWDCVRINE